MPKQHAVPGLRNALKKKVTRREQFLAEMDAVVPWTRLQALIAPHYPKAGRPSSSRCSPSATCSWFEEGCWHKDEFVRNLRNRRYGGPEDAKSATNDPYAGPHGDQSAISVQPNALIRPSLMRMRKIMGTIW
jgi:hypothetical protein